MGREIRVVPRVALRPVPGGRVFFVFTGLTCHLGNKTVEVLPKLIPYGSERNEIERRTDDMPGPLE